MLDFRYFIFQDVNILHYGSKTMGCTHAVGVSRYCTGGGGGGGLHHVSNILPCGDSLSSAGVEFCDVLEWAAEIVLSLRTCCESSKASLLCFPFLSKARGIVFLHSKH